MVKALPRFVHKGRTYTIDERLNEVRSYEYEKKPIVYRGVKAKSFLKKTGWFGESARHSLAAKKIKTGRKSYSPTPYPEPKKSEIHWTMEKPILPPDITKKDIEFERDIYGKKMRAQDLVDLAIIRKFDPALDLWRKGENLLIEGEDNKAIAAKDKAFDQIETLIKKYKSHYHGNLRTEIEDEARSRGL